MEIIQTNRQLKRYLQEKTNIGLVPTMGNLHAGHLSLMQLARSYSDTLLASIFVNRLQFGPNEDFDQYPRTLEADLVQLAAAGVDAVFTPNELEIYPKPPRFKIQPPPLAEELEGAYRPGFFQGVCTVVLKLFHLTNPSVAAFGKKDRQQLTLIQAMVEDLNLPIQILAGETVRAEDGLALSSRNGYLSPTEREEAPRLYRVLSTIAQKITQKIQLQDTVLEAKQIGQLGVEAAAILSQRGWHPDYIEIRDKTTLAAISPSTAIPANSLVVLGAASLGKTRLIDNLEIT